MKALDKLNPEISQNLLVDETILYKTKKHYIIFFTPGLWTLVAFIFLMIGHPLVNKVAFIPGLIALASWLNEFLNYYTSEFVITNKRILMREGFFFKHTNEMRLATIANATVNQSLLGQLLNYGTIILYPFGGNADPFMQIAFPNEFQKQLQLQLDKIVR